MTTFADLFSSLKDELVARYRSPIWGSALIMLTVYHWRIFVFFLTEKQNAKDTIAFIEANISVASIASAIALALCYVIAFPWVELLIAHAASSGKRARSDFHTEEREREIGRRKLIAQQQAQLIEIELKNKNDQSKLADIALVRDYKNVLQGESFVRWMQDIENGPINSNMENTINNYLNKVDSIEGKFIDPVIESAHSKFVSDLSTLGSALNDGKPGQGRDDARLDVIKKFSRKALASQQEYRQVVREQLGV